MTLPYSDAYFLSAYPRECTETFQTGHVAAFELGLGLISMRWRAEKLYGQLTIESPVTGGTVLTWQVPTSE